MQLKVPTAQQLSLATLSVAANLTYFVLPLMIGAIADTRGVSDTQSGFLATIQILTTATLTCTLFPFAQKLRAKPTLYLGLATLVIGNIATLGASSMTGLVPIRMLVGCAEALVNVVVSILIGQDEEVERGFAIQAFGIGLASALVSIAAPLLTPTFGDNAIFLILGLFPLAAMLLVGRSATSSAPTASIDTPRHSTLRLLRRPMVLLMLLSFFLMVVATNATFAFFERSAQHLGISFNQILYLMFPVNFITLAGPLAAHVAGLRFGRLAPLFVSYSAIGFGAIMIGFASTPVVLFSGLILQSTAVMLAYPYMRGLAAAMDPLGRVLTLTLGIIVFGIAVTPAIAALVLTGSHGFHGLAVLSAILIVIASATLLPVMRRSRRDLQFSAGDNVEQNALVSHR